LGAPHNNKEEVNHKCLGIVNNHHVNLRKKVREGEAPRRSLCKRVTQKKKGCRRRGNRREKETGTREGFCKRKEKEPEGLPTCPAKAITSHKDGGGTFKNHKHRSSEKRKGSRKKKAKRILVLADGEKNHTRWERSGVVGPVRRGKKGKRSATGRQDTPLPKKTQNPTPTKTGETRSSA